MKLQEAVKQFGMSSQTLHAYEEAGLLRVGARQEYLDEDIARLGLIDTLVTAGFSLCEIKQYIGLPEQEQISVLRRQRQKLLGDIHVKQQTLDSIDYIIWDKRKGAGR